MNPQGLQWFRIQNMTLTLKKNSMHVCVCVSMLALNNIIFNAKLQKKRERNLVKIAYYKGKKQEGASSCCVILFCCWCCPWMNVIKRAKIFADLFFFKSNNKIRWEQVNGTPGRLFLFAKYTLFNSYNVLY